MQLPRTSTLTWTIPDKLLIFYSKILIWFRFLSEYSVIGIAFLFSIFGWKYYFDLGLVLSYNDSMSHLDISRRIVENLTPGIAQIGSVWLPLPHLLSLPFIWSNFLWHTGLAGSIISNIAFVGSAYFIFKLLRGLTKDYLAAILGVLIFVVNPNMVYMQSIPMTESLLIFFFIATVYYIFQWQRTDDIKSLIMAGFFTLFSTLTRYDGWMLLAQMFVVIAVIAYQYGGLKKLESRLILFLSVATFGIILWVIWNYLIFGDPLYFINGPFSAKAQQLVFEAEGRLFAKGNFLYSTFVYILAVIKNNGSLMTFIGGIGLVLYFFKNKFSKESLSISLLLSPLIFNVAALYLGHSIINLPDIPPYTLFNVRYGLMMLPAIAVFIAYLSKKQRLIQIVFLVLLIAQTFYMYKDNDVITVRDGISGASAQGMKETGKWLGDHAKEGKVLIAASSQDSLIFQSGLPMSRFIHEGNADIWNVSLERPTTYATWVAMHRGDLVYRKLADNTNFLNNYEKVYDGGFTDIYKISRNVAKPLTTNDLP